MMGQCLEPAAEDAGIDHLPSQLQSLAKQLNAGQQRIFEMVFSNLLLPQSSAEGNQQNDDNGQKRQIQQFLMLHGEAGSGKTFLYNKICEGADILGIKIIVCAATGIAATTMKKSSTVHAAFGLPIFVGMKKASKLKNEEGEQTFKLAKLVIIDEVSMLDVRVLEAVDVKLRKLCGIDVAYGGKSIILGGDRMQLVPVSGRKQSIYSSPKMLHFCHFELRQQMRQSGDPEYTEWLRKIGIGQIELVHIPLPNVVDSIEALINFVYGPNLLADPQSFGLIISPTNRAVNLVNNIVLAKMDGEEECFEAVDTLAVGMEEFMPAEEDLTKIAAKTLKLKAGAIVMLLKNLRIASGLANGTRLIYVGSNKKLLCFKEFNQPRRIHFIGRSAMMIPLKTAVGEGAKGAYLRRLQFPVRLAYATTIHKGQSQTVDKLGLYLAENGRMFAEGMAYTALSRLRSIHGLRVFSETADAQNQIQFQNICSPYALATITTDGKWVPAPEEGNVGEEQQQQ